MVFETSLGTIVNATGEILNRLATADREHQKEAGVRLLLQSVKYLLGALLGLFLLDLVFQLGPRWRLGLDLALAAGIIGFGVVLWRVAMVRRNRLEHIARFLEGQDAALGSRLINLLQLREQITDASLSPRTRELARLAVEGYVEELKGTPLERLAWTGELRRHGWRAGWAGAAFLLLLGVCFPLTLVEFARYGDPFGDHPPYSFTRLEITSPGPAGTNVLYGKGLVVRVKASGHQPKEVFLTAAPTGHPEQAVTLPMFDKGRVGFDQLLNNVRTELTVYAHTKNRNSLSKQVRIGIILTPKLEKAFVQIAPPAYTGLKTEEKPYTFQGIQALAGSQVRFRLQSNRPLKQGLLELFSGDGLPQKISLAPVAENEVAGAFSAADSGRLRFGLVDVSGLPSQDVWEGPLTVTQDLPPEIRIAEPERDGLVALDFKLAAQVEANDDYGLSAVRIHRGLNGVYSAPRVITYNTLVRTSREEVDFDFGALGVQPGDIVSLYAEALDTAPKPHLARSQVVRLRVISVEEYNNYLRERTDLADAEAKYSALQAELEELIEEQKNLAKSAQSLQEQVAKAPPKAREDLTRQLDQLLARQNELNQKLNKQADRLEHFVRENPVYDVEEEVSKLLREQADLIRQSTRTNDALNRQVAQRSAPAAGPRQLSEDMPADLKRAADEQVARLTGSRETTEQQIAQTLQDMSLMQELQKDFSQFEALYESQQELAAQVQAYNRAGQLSREDQLALKELAGMEKQVGELLEQLKQKLGEDAAAAEKLFPKAARSGRDLARAIEELRLPPLARQATSQMLAGDGERSYGLAERLRTEMAKLFSQCQGGNSPQQGELDAYLKLQRSLNPGKNFAQMARSRKFGRVGGPPGSGMAEGEGATGSSGYAVSTPPTLDVMGNEQSAQKGSATTKPSSRFGKGAGAAAELAKGGNDGKGDALKNLNPVNRQSGAVSSEAALDEYSDLVDTYFKAITTRKNP